MSFNVDGDNNNDGRIGTNQKKQQHQSPQRKNENIHQNYQTQISGMTPSIITTINNTNPHAPTDYPNSITNNGNTLTRNRRTNEPYESYIEDSFVGHWEREDDDDPQGDYNDENGRHIEGEGVEGEESALQHASTLEFDFDSFGPESFIYTPASTTATSNTTVIAKDSNTPTTEELSPKLLDTDDVKSTPTDQVNVLNQTNGSSSNAGVSPSESPRPTPTRSPAYKINTNPPDYLVDPTQIDLKVIEPYKKVISHAGYCHHFDPSVAPPNAGEPAPAIIVFSACYLPDRSRRDYNYVMDHLFLYVLSSLHELIADDYILIYLHNTQPSSSAVANSTTTTTNRLVASGSSTSSGSGEEVQNPNNLPTFTWMKRCYQMIDRKLRKNLKILYLVKPTFWLKTIVIMCKPFISAKFSRKLRFVENMDGLRKCLPVDRLILPASAENL